MKKICIALIMISIANAEAKEVLIQIYENEQIKSLSSEVQIKEDLKFNNWYLAEVEENQINLLSQSNSHIIKNIQNNFNLRISDTSFFATDKKNPPISDVTPIKSGTDPLISKQWGMIDIMGPQVSLDSPTRNSIVVAVIDTGVDYNHPDLRPNLWFNKKEIPNNNIDDDKNGYVDDVIGYDFVDNDPFPFDITSSGNAGHGTHCAGNVAARGGNNQGIMGVAPYVKIMPVRFLNSQGSGTTAGAIKSIKYAVDNGAQVLSNSYGGTTDGAQSDRAFEEVIEYAKSKNVIFVAAAGNSRVNNDTSKKREYPGSFKTDNIISVAAIDKNDKLASFSSYGVKSVDIGAPGVKVYSTTVGGKYSDRVGSSYWSGTSMATPHVAGAAALYLSHFPNANYKQVINAIYSSAVPIKSLRGKTVTGAKLNLEKLLDY